MTDNSALVLTLVAFFMLIGFVCWLSDRSPHTHEPARRHDNYYWRVEYKPSGNIEAAPTRKPKPVPQPNRRKKKKARR